MSWIFLTLPPQTMLDRTVFEGVWEQLPSVDLPEQQHPDTSDAHSGPVLRLYLI